MGKNERNFGRVVSIGALFLTSCVAKVEAKNRTVLIKPTPVPTYYFRPPELPVPTQVPIPTPVPAPMEIENNLPTLQEFVSFLKDGKSHIRGVYSPGEFAFGVVQQPEGQNDFISPRDLYFTQFDLKSIDKNINATAFLVHNLTYAGGEVTKMQNGQKIIIVNGLGEMKDFTIQEIVRVQTLDPTNKNSDLIDLLTGRKYSAKAFFNKIYEGSENKVVFQTCISKDGNDSWGRIFVIGRP